ncbi:MAG: ATP-binding protein [Rhizobiaceae bacterium]
MAASVVAVILAAELAGAAHWLGPLLAVAFIATAILLPLPSERTAPSVAGLKPNEGNPGTLSASAFAAALNDPVIFFERDGAVVDANAAAIEAFGAISPGLSLLLKFRAPEIRMLVEESINGEAPLPIDYIERLPVERVFKVSASSLGKDGKLSALVFKDQSEARRIDRMRADFIANASHELRTPLASVSGFIETLRGPARNDVKARDQFLDIMLEQTRRMARLLDDLLSLSRLEMKPRVSGAAKVNLREILARVIDAQSPVAKDYGVVIETTYADMNTSIAGDRDELFQVFENLIENASKYGRSGGKVVVSLAKGTSGPQPEIDVTVTDFGPGIAAEHIPRITERFYRIDAEASRQHKGTGLGLAIVKHILTRHGGRLSIKSEPGRGSSFTAHFPIQTEIPQTG